ncbi:MAG: hypothetical protein B7Y41_14815 [Hydrogenophilales bacterium 28-61-23]|nr:MAG: hypothetical protein B7Y41_14815 [Hydrogenophilales bacterium 28-61-23]
MPWLVQLKQLVEKKPIVVLRFGDDEWWHLQESRRGISEFTFARPHGLLDCVKAPTPCLFQGSGEDCQQHLYFGLIASRNPVTTLESHIKVRRVVQIQPNSEAELCRLITEVPHAKNLKDRLQDGASVVPLSPKLSSHLLERLVSIESNRGGMRTVAESLSTPKYFRGNAALQEDAVRTALMAFGLAPDHQAKSLELAAGRETALGRVGIKEDSVIEHDARSFPGYELVQSGQTGRAIFESKGEQLEIFTANRRDLEEVFGVDLIYLNMTKQNIVMLQYKMLEASRKDAADTDWIYRPDDQLKEQIAKMQKFTVDHAPGQQEYRLNTSVFYLKFVKRDGSIRNGSIITPLDHFEKLLVSPVCQGPRGGLRVSYESLSGRYLRQNAFLDLLRSGYIGAYAETTSHMKVLVEQVLCSNRAVVAAIQRPVAID